MKNEDTKRLLEDLKKQIEGLSYYLSDIKVIKDRKAQQNLAHAQRTMQDMEYKLQKNLRDLSNEMNQSKSEQVEESRKISLGKINSPNEKMIQARDFNLNVRKSMFSSMEALKKLSSDNDQKLIQLAKESGNAKRADQEDKQ